MFSCWCKQMQHYCLIIPVWLFFTWFSKVWFSESLCNKYLPYFQFQIGNGGHTTHQSLRCNKSLKYFSSSLWRAKILKYCSSTLFKAPFIPESEIVNNVPLSMALRNAENRIMSPKSNSGKCRRAFHFSPLSQENQKNVHIDIRRHVGMEI